MESNSDRSMEELLGDTRRDDSVIANVDSLSYEDIFSDIFGVDDSSSYVDSNEAIGNAFGISEKEAQTSPFRTDKIDQTSEKPLQNGVPEQIFPRTAPQTDFRPSQYGLVPVTVDGVSPTTRFASNLVQEPPVTESRNTKRLIIPDGVGPEEIEKLKKERRKEQNRRAAALSRERKKAHSRNLESIVYALQMENTLLRQKTSSLEQEVFSLKSRLYEEKQVDSLNMSSFQLPLWFRNVDSVTVPGVAVFAMAIMVFTIWISPSVTESRQILSFSSLFHGDEIVTFKYRQDLHSGIYTSSRSGNFPAPCENREVESESRRDSSL